MRCSSPGGRIRKFSVFLVLAAAFLTSVAHAQQADVIGPVYAIAEPSLLEVILSKLRDTERTGALARLQRDAQSKIAEAVKAPQPLAGLTKAKVARTRYYDPSIVVPYPITDAEGRILVAAGTMVNPLDTVSLSKRLLFFDGRDPQQLARARALLDQHRGRVKLILTAGSYLDLMRNWKQPVFFDQRGHLTQKLRIEHVPALVTQEGKRLRIDELP